MTMRLAMTASELFRRGLPRHFRRSRFPESSAADPAGQMSDQWGLFHRYVCNQAVNLLD